MRTALNEMKVHNVDKDKAGRLLRLIAGRTQSKVQYGTLTRTFQSWKDHLRVEPLSTSVAML